MAMRAFARHAGITRRKYTSTSIEPPCPYRGFRPKDWGPPPPPETPEAHELRRERRFTAAAARFSSTLGGERDGGKETPTMSRVIEGNQIKEPGYTAAYAMFEGLWEVSSAPSPRQAYCFFRGHFMIDIVTGRCEELLRERRVRPPFFP